MDNNGLELDPMLAEKERKVLNSWTEDDKQVCDLYRTAGRECNFTFQNFIKKYLLFPKNFQKIAQSMENKTTQEVVWFYYTHKRKLELKKLLRDQARKRSVTSRKLSVNSSGGHIPRELANLASSPNFWMDSGTRLSARSFRAINYNEAVMEQQSGKPTILTSHSEEGMQIVSLVCALVCFLCA